MLYAASEDKSRRNLGLKSMRDATVIPKVSLVSGAFGQRILLYDHVYLYRSLPSTVFP